jgi:nuclear pore complex protein Nup98-Nup96
MIEAQVLRHITPPLPNSHLFSASYRGNMDRPLFTISAETARLNVEEEELTPSESPGFGSAQNNAFGAKPSGFGGTAATTGGSLFGSGTATSGTSGFGGFGSPAPTSNTSFGSSNTGGGLFGAAKPAFGGTTTTTSNPFGGASSTPFGGTATGAFGAPASTALGANTGECQGTGSVPFQPFIEKEPNSTTNQQNSFQSISFQQPYQKFSPEELRLADYAQGRRYGNQSNQPGAFGSTNFGGFNQTQSTPAFGAGSTTNATNPFGGGTTGSAFGTSQPQQTGFGSGTATSGGLFGQNKPATGGLFGSQPQAQASTGLFGSTPSTGFGSGTTRGFGANTQGTGTSLFGANANKPAFNIGGAAPASTSGGFGSTPASTGGFGGGGLFGNTGQQQATSTGFGQQPQQQQPAQNPFGGFGGAAQPAGGLFGGANQQKPAGGLFGNAPAATGTGGLFGSSQPAANTNPFGGAANTQSTGGLFGGQKPATPGASLFGGATTQANTGGGGLFGGFGGQNQNQPQQQQTGGLFGGLNTNNQQKPSLFSQPQQQGGGGLFGNTGNQQQGGGLFGLGGNQQQQQQQQPQPQNSLFGGGSSSIFGGSQQNQQPQSLTASINDSAAFGNASLFSNLASSQINNPGPLATPLSSSAKQKKAAALPLYKLNSASTSRFTTPSKRGFGFSYSNYGTPGSVSSVASTPGATFSGSFLGGNMNRTLNKSISTSNLRRSFNAEDSILAPGAFSASPGVRQYGSTGSMKKLVINRSLRSDLFSPPKEDLQQTPSTPNGGILKKRVSFDSSTLATNGTSSPLKQVQSSATPSSEELGYMRPRQNGQTNGSATSPEMEQVGNELAIVHEEEVSAPAPPAASKPVSLEDQEPGQYWMKPSKAEIEGMTRDQRRAVSGFTVGREGVGHVAFSTVDLRDINLDDLFDNLIVLTVRSATVYPNSAKKPPRGKGLNVPSTIALQNSWPRGKDKRTPIADKTGSKMRKHIERLQRVDNTKFVDYEASTGVWSFQVDHFTTYSLDLDEDEVSEFGQSTLSAAPDTPTPKSRTPGRTPVGNFDESFSSGSQLSRSGLDPDDTFEFKKSKRVLPGAFDDEEAFDEEVEMADYDEQQQFFLDERSVGSPSEDGVEEPVDDDDVFADDESVSVVDQEMAGSFPQADNTTGLDDSHDGMDIVEDTPGGVMRARMRALKNSDTPVKRNFAAGNDWVGTLATTISPQKQDRALLKTLVDLGEDLRPDHEPASAVRSRVVSDGRGFATSIDLMNSLWGQTKSPVKAAKVPAKPKGFEVGVPS